MNSNIKRGALYIVFGDNFIKEMLYSVESLKKYNPDLHVTVFSNKEINSSLIDNVRVIDVKHMRPKIDYIHETPYEETIFLDTDTIINHSLNDAFDILNKYDIALAHDLARKRKKFNNVIPEYEAIPYSFSEINTGVIVFKNNDNIKKLFENWRHYFYKYYNVVPWDQPSFRISIWNCDAKLYIFPVEYNVRSKSNREKQDRFHHEFGEEHLKPRIFHMHADPRINQGAYDVESLENALEYCKENFLRY